MNVQARVMENAKQRWQSAADMMPQIICLLDGEGRLIHSNRTVERWGLGKVAEAKGTYVHDVLHQGCVDPECYIKQMWPSAARKPPRRTCAECEVFDPVLKRHLTVLVKPLARLPRQFRGTDDPHAVMIIGDISDFKQAEAGYQRLYEALECLACHEKERREHSEKMQAGVLAILEETSDYIAMTDAAGAMLYLNPAGRALLGLAPGDDISRMTLCEHSDQEVKDRIREQAVPWAIRHGQWKGESTLRNRAGREFHVSLVINAHRGNHGELENLSTIVRDISEQVNTAQALRESHAELQRLSGLLVSIQEEERRRISLDLHDGLGQSLSLIKLSIEGAVRQLALGAAGDAQQSLQQLIPRVKEALAEVRRVATELRPSILDDLGILRTLSWFFREFEAARGDIVVEQALNIHEHDVPVPLQITLYRILQEATSNIVKHAGADRVRIRLHRDDEALHLLIEDNGCGFDPDSVPCVEGQRRGLGLLSIKERASLSGGSYRLTSSPGQGTRIEIHWQYGQLPA